MEFHGLQTYMKAKRSTFFQSTFCSCGADMNCFCTFCDKSFNRKENMQKALDFQISQCCHPISYRSYAFTKVSAVSFRASILLPEWLPD